MQIRKPFIGTVRRMLFVSGTYRWNGWVRSVTASRWIEGVFLRREG